VSGKVSGIVHDLPSWVKGWPRAVLGTLAELSDEQGNVVYQREPLYMKVLGGRTGCSDRTARSAVNWLEEQGLVSVKRPKGKGNPNEYRIVLSKLHRIVPTPFASSKAEGASGFGGGKEERASGFTGPKPESSSGFASSKAEGASGFGRGIKEPYLSTVREGMDEERVEIKTAPARDNTPPPNRLSKQYFARKPARSTGPPGRAAPPEEAPANPTTIPPDFEITAGMKRWGEGKAREYGAALNMDLLADKFLNYYRRGRGKNTEQLDWEGCWQDWVIRDIEKLEAAGHAGKAGKGNGSNGQRVAGPGESRRALAVKQRWRERTGTELDEVSFGGVSDQAPDDRGRSGRGRGHPPDSS
jgi:hypothetical protein